MLEKVLPSYAIAPLRARLLATEGNAEPGLEILADALAGLSHKNDHAIRVTLYCQRAQLALEAGDLLAALADIDEAEKFAERCGKEELSASVCLDRAEALLAAGETEDAFAALPPDRKIARRLESRRRSILCRLEGSPAPGEMETLAGAESSLAYARSQAIEGEIEKALETLLSLEDAGWFALVEAFRADSLLIKALMDHERGDDHSAFEHLKALRQISAPGTARRLAPAADWLRMRIAAARGDTRRALSAGRRVLASLERARQGIHSLDHLRRISGGFANLYSEIIAMELRNGDVGRAYNSLQQFSARALLRRSADRSWIGGESESGLRGLELALRKYESAGKDALRWPELIAILEKLGSEY